MYTASAVDFCEVMATPDKFEGRPIKLQATARVLYGGILLESDKCKAQDVSLHYKQGYEQKSDAAAIKVLKKLERNVRDAALSGRDEKVEQSMVSMLVEGTLEKNPYYHVQIDRGDRTLMAWDYNYKYAFVVSRILEVGVLRRSTVPR
jgi:hypothetical protein